MKVTIRSRIPPQPQKPAPPKRNPRSKRSRPLPIWLAGGIFLGGLLVIGIFLAVRYSRAGYEGPDKYPEFRKLREQVQAQRDAAAKHNSSNAAPGKSSGASSASDALPPNVAKSIPLTSPPPRQTGSTARR
jgi:hypothetical protein